MDDALKSFYDAYIVLPSTEIIIADLDWILERGLSGASTPSMITGG